MHASHEGCIDDEDEEVGPRLAERATLSFYTHTRLLNASGCH
jgi:hypothetical protein